MSRLMNSATTTNNAKKTRSSTLIKTAAPQATTNSSLLVIVFALLGIFSYPALAQQDDDQSYLLNTGDTIRIDVYREDDLSTSVLLNKTGQFSYPYLGMISAQRKTTEQLATEIEKGLRGDYLITPEVNVSIEKYRNFYIGGEVRSPGGYAYQPGLTVKQAIVLAGGPTEWASSSRYKIQREGSTESLRANEETPIKPGDTLSLEAGLF